MAPCYRVAHLRHQQCSLGARIVRQHPPANLALEHAAEATTAPSCPCWPLALCHRQACLAAQLLLLAGFRAQEKPHRSHCPPPPPPPHSPLHQIRRLAAVRCQRTRTSPARTPAPPPDPLPLLSSMARERGWRGGKCRTTPTDSRSSSHTRGRHARRPSESGSCWALRQRASQSPTGSALAHALCSCARTVAAVGAGEVCSQELVAAASRVALVVPSV